MLGPGGFNSPAMSYSDGRTSRMNGVRLLEADVLTGADSSR
jgi:hypothetical protein